MKYRFQTSLLPFLAGIAAFVLVAFIGVEHFTKQYIISRGQFDRYELNTVDTAGRPFLLLCYEGGITHGSDLELNLTLRTFKSLSVANGRNINTTNPLQCIKYPADTFEVEQRVARLPAKMKGEKRLVFIGDSITFGEGVRQGSAFPQVMERLLSWHGNAGGWRIVNLGRPGIDLLQIYNLGFTAALKTQPDEIVYVWTPDDIPKPDPLQREYNEQNNLVFHPRYPPPRHGYSVSDLMKRRKEDAAATRNNLKWIHDAYGSRNREGLRLFAEYMRRMNREAKNEGVKFRVALFPILADGQGGYPLKDIHARVRVILSREHIETTDMTRGVLAQPAVKLRISPIDGHPNDTAHFLAAKTLYNRLGLSPQKITRQQYSEKIPDSNPMPAEKNPYSRKGGATAVFFFFFVMASFALLAAAGAGIASECFRGIRRENVASLIALSLIVCLSFALRAWYSSHIHMSFTDELNRCMIVSEWLQGRFDAVTSDDIPGEMVLFFLSFKIFGLNPNVGYWLTVLLSSATTVIVYAIARLIWKDLRTALIAALLLATCPLNLRFAGSQAIDPHNMFFLSLCAFAFLLDLRRGNARTLLFFAAACSFTLFVRIDNIVFILTLYLYRCILFFMERRNMESPRPRTGPAFAATLAIAVMGIVAFAFFFVHCTANTPQSSHLTGMVANIQKNLPGNAAFFINNNALPRFVTIFAVIGILATLFAKNMRGQQGTSILLLLWLAVVFAVQLTSAAGGYDLRLFKDTVRYANSIIPPLLALCAMGLCMAMKSVREPHARAALWGAAIAYILTLPLHFNHFIKDASNLTQINETINRTIQRYPYDMKFFTNSENIYEILLVDLRRDVTLLKNGKNIPSHCGNGGKCAFIFYQAHKSAELNILSPQCYDSFTFREINMYICPLEQAASLPDDILRQPGETRKEYRRREL